MIHCVERWNIVAHKCRYKRFILAMAVKVVDAKMPIVDGGHLAVVHK
jgi:hypothetical protein